MSAKIDRKKVKQRGTFAGKVIIEPLPWFYGRILICAPSLESAQVLQRALSDKLDQREMLDWKDVAADPDKYDKDHVVACVFDSFSKALLAMGHGASFWPKEVFIPMNGRWAAARDQSGTAWGSLVPLKTTEEVLAAIPAPKWTDADLHVKSGHSSLTSMCRTASVEKPTGK